MDGRSLKDGAPPAGEAGSVRYRVVMPAGAGEQELGRFEVRDLIRSHAIDEETAISTAGTDDWKRAGDVPELKRYFELVRAAAGVPKKKPGPAAGAAQQPDERCRNHADALPTFSCVSCAATWCDACVVRNPAAPQVPPACPLDRGMCKPVVYETLVEPISRRVLASLGYPFAAGGLLYLFFYVAFRVVGSLWGYFPPSTFGFLLFLFLAWMYDLEIIRASSNGERTLPSFPEVDDLWSTFARGVKVFLVTLICWAPFLVAGWWAVGQVADKVVSHVTQELQQPLPAETPSAGEDEEAADAADEEDAPAATMTAEQQAALEQLQRLQQQIDAQRRRSGATGSLPAVGGPGSTQAEEDGPGGLADLLMRIVAWSIPYLVLLLVVGLACYSYFWMCLGYAAVWDSVLPALDPRRIVASIRACGSDYALFLGLAIGSAILVIGCNIALSFVPFVGWILAIVVESILSFWILHLLGWMILRHQVDLDWD